MQSSQQQPWLQKQIHWHLNYWGFTRTFQRSLTSVQNILDSMTDGFQTAEAWKIRHQLLSLGDFTGCISCVHPHLTVLCHSISIPETTPYPGVTSSSLPLALDPIWGAGLQNQRSKWCGPATSTRDSITQLFLPTFPIDSCKDEEQEDFILVSSSGVLEDRDTYQVVKQAWQRHLQWVFPCPKAECGTNILMRQEERLGKSDSPPKAADSPGWKQWHQKLFLKLSWRVSVLTAGFRHLEQFSLWCSHLCAGRLRDQLCCLRAGPGEPRVLSLAVVINRCPELGITKMMVIPPLPLQKLYSLAIFHSGISQARHHLNSIYFSGHTP